MPNSAPPVISWGGALRYAWRDLKEGWVRYLAGTVGVAILAALLQWVSGGLSAAAFHRASGGGLIWSLLAVLVWLVVLAARDLVRAPMGHAREVLADRGTSSMIAAPTASLLGRLRPLLKRGRAILDQIGLEISFAPPSGVRATELAIEWHDEAYELLMTERSDLARRFLDCAPGLVESSSAVVAGNKPRSVMQSQVACLAEIIEELERQN